MTHPDIAAQIRTAIAEERFEEAEKLLPAFAQAVLEECVTAADEGNFASARAFLRASILEMRARRAHLAQRLHEAQRARSYVASTTLTRHDLDITG